MDLPYGSTTFPLDLPPHHLAGVIRPDLTPADLSPEVIVAEALDHCQPLISSFRPGERVVIVTSDITRYTGSEVYLPLLVDRLNRQGIPDQAIEILIALGIHRRQSHDEHRRIVGALYDRVRVIDHDCDDPTGLISLGRTTSGIEVVINRRAVEADRLILTGVIGFHYFAGFGGGRKSLLPGIASRAACIASHFAVLNPAPGGGKNPLARTGNLEANPVHQALVEACALAAPDLILNTVLSLDKRIIAAFSGHWQEAHERGCRFYRQRFSFPLRQKAELVVVSCGGFPKDINMIQAHKAMEYASFALQEGGVMVLLAECRDGLGNPDFFKWFRHRRLAELEAALRANYEIYGQTAYSVLQKAQRFTVILVSTLPPGQVEAIGMRPAKSLAEAMAQAIGVLAPGWQALVLPEGGSVLPVVL